MSEEETAAELPKQDKAPAEEEAKEEESNVTFDPIVRLKMTAL